MIDLKIIDITNNIDQSKESSIASLESKYSRVYNSNNVNNSVSHQDNYSSN